jgi:hypothetical protein
LVNLPLPIPATALAVRRLAAARIDDLPIGKQEQLALIGAL